MRELKPLRGKIKIKHGFAFKGEHFASHGTYVVLTPGNFHEGGGFKRDEAKDKFYTSAFPEEYILDTGDLIVAMTEQTDGLLGSCAFVPESDLYLHNQRLGLISCDPEEVDPEFLYYLFQTSSVRKQIRLSSTGSKVKHTSPDRIYDVLAPLLDVQDQRKLSMILKNLDAKITLNNEINAELDAMAKLIYDYWFIQFDFPDGNGKPYKSSGGKMVWCEQLKRLVPLGWQPTSLWNIARYFNGLAMQKHRPLGEEFLPVIKIREMGEGFNKGTERAKPDLPSDAIVENGDILFSWSATLEVMIWSGGRGALNQHIFKVTPLEHSKPWVYFQLRNYLSHFKMMAERRKTTMGHITQDHLKQSRVIDPPSKLVKDFEKLVAPMLSQQVQLRTENQELIRLRDWLLPMLMNGQISVRD
ncbi:restriction endonuclease subunit S [Ruegeria sp. 2205SS24-7]|uniref:restriction endonuclease subunit S n=1 Tax=Ruegeria discodermiae TaxID=3064389 RepID=UPI0027425FEF|nr:restriction endonuclease subunit S [Ruegeria sp. 2205SS24-7]MDP5219686.1 restriction endonuclease subunit S [Ruegeria sp. 2205SS24-7]